ncbi:MAG: pyridoxal-phosphate dependent enzyme [Salinisphaeraceae bacterium]|nr:pyridoxal-phosphate dependent enzyme [Salinisphaeraceae bacterium]
MNSGSVKKDFQAEVEATDAQRQGKVRPLFNSDKVENMASNKDESQGFHHEIEALLVEQVNQNPESLSARAKLLEFYFTNRHSEDFLREAHHLQRTCKRSDDPQLWDSLAEMGKRLMPDEQLFMTMGDGIEFTFDLPDDYEEESAYKRLGEDDHYKPYFARLIAYRNKNQDHGAVMLELEKTLRQFLCRPTPMLHAERLSAQGGGAQIFVKREDQGAAWGQLMIAITGQALLAKRMGMRVLVTASTNGFRGVAMATIARGLGMRAIVFADSRIEVEQPGNLLRLALLGADVMKIDMSNEEEGADIRQYALDYCLPEANHAFMVTGLDALPTPYPDLHLEFQSVIGRECIRQVKNLADRVPDLVVTRAGDNADAIGAFAPFLRRSETRLACVSTLSDFAQHDDGADTWDLTKQNLRHSPHANERKRMMSRVLEGLQYPSVRREHAWLKNTGRVEYPEVNQAQVKQAIRDFSKEEGFIPGIGTAHALAYAQLQAAEMSPEQAVVVVTSENTDLSIEPIAELVGIKPE